MTVQNVSRLVSPLGVQARVAGARHPGGYMCRVPSSIDPRSPSTRSFQVPDGTSSRPPGIAGIIILSRQPARRRVAGIFDNTQPPIHHQTFQQRPLPQFAISVTSVINNDT